MMSLQMALKVVETAVPFNDVINLVEPPVAFNATSMGAPVCDDLEPEQIDFTLVTQLSVSRLSLMKEQCRRWGNHPISVAVASPVSKPAIKKLLIHLGCNDITLSVVIVGKSDPYPINSLRNIAFSKVNTSHAVYVDADFMVSPNLYQSLAQQRGNLLDHRDAVVIPALEFRPVCPACEELHLQMLPETKAEAFKLFASGREKSLVKQFDYDKDAGGHGSTRTKEWFKQRPHTLEPLKCIRSDRYEPYLVVRYCKDLPPFQEVFKGYGQNKVTWSRHLVRAGYRFQRLADGFAMHVPHERSDDWKRRKKIEMVRGHEALEVTKLSYAYDDWLETFVADKRVIPQCAGVKQKKTRR